MLERDSQPQHGIDELTLLILLLILHIAKQLSDLFVESLSDTAERETRIQLAALNNYPGRRKKNRRPHQFEFSLRPLVAASTITYGIA